MFTDCRGRLRNFSTVPVGGVGCACVIGPLGKDGGGLDDGREGAGLFLSGSAGGAPEEGGCEAGGGGGCEKGGGGGCDEGGGGEVGGGGISGGGGGIESGGGLEEGRGGGSSS